MAKRPDPPKTLGTAGKKLWRAIERDLEDGLQHDARELQFLHRACSCEDEMAGLEKALTKEGVTVIGSRGRRESIPRSTSFASIDSHSFAFSARSRWLTPSQPSAAQLLRLETGSPCRRGSLGSGGSLMARRVEAEQVRGIPAGLSRWWIERDMERGLTLEEAIEKSASRPSAKERWDHPEVWQRWQRKYAPNMLRTHE